MENHPSRNQKWNSLKPHFHSNTSVDNHNSVSLISMYSTCLDNLGQCNTNRDSPICVVSPEVAKVCKVLVTAPR